MSDFKTKPGNKCPGGLACGQGCPYGPCKDCTRTAKDAPKERTSLGQTEFDLLGAKCRAEQYIDANVCDGEIRAAMNGDDILLTTDELKNFVYGLLEHLGT